MRLHFVTPECPYCSITETSIQFINLHLPFGDRIEQVDINSTDPRNAFMGSVFGKEGWAVPLLVVDNPGTGKFFDSYISKRMNRVVVRSVELREDYTRLLRGILI